MVDKNARTLRAVPVKGSKEIHHTFAFVQFHVQFFGMTLALARAGHYGLSFDVEFEDHSQAENAYINCEIPGMHLYWPPRNIMDKSPPVPTVVSFRPPRFDYPSGTKQPSLPVPWNNPFCVEWVELEGSTTPWGTVTHPVHPPSVQRVPPDPRKPFDFRHWPVLPRVRLQQRRG
ncbi:unnamed protein product [Alopecurus aequalis]